MRPLSHCLPNVQEPCEVAINVEAVPGGVREARLRHDAADVVGEARCPCCRAPLVARMGRGGPYFHCLCRERGNEKARRADCRAGPLPYGATGI
jgi:hypothetical protein